MLKLGLGLGLELRVDLAMLDPACDCEHPELDAPPHRLAQARECQESEGLAALSETPLDLPGDANHAMPRTEVRLQG